MIVIVLCHNDIGSWLEIVGLKLLLNKIRTIVQSCDNSTFIVEGLQRQNLIMFSKTL